MSDPLSKAATAGVRRAMGVPVRSRRGADRVLNVFQKDDNRVFTGDDLLFLEAVANVLKHACARHVLLRLTSTHGVLQVLVEDDGRGGVDPGGVGVRGLCDRVEALGGTVTIDSRPGRTRMTATLPEESRG